MSDKINKAIQFLQKIVQKEMLAEQHLKQLVADRTAVEKVRKRLQLEEPGQREGTWLRCLNVFGLVALEENPVHLKTGNELERKLHQSVYTLLRIQEMELTTEIAKARQELDWIRSEANLVEVFIDYAKESAPEKVQVQ